MFVESTVQQLWDEKENNLVLIHAGCIGMGLRCAGEMTLWLQLRPLSYLQAD